MFLYRLFTLISSTFKRAKKEIASLATSNLPREPSFRIVSIEQTKDGDYTALIQTVYKSSVFKMKPEEILADDRMTSSFSPLDVRTLTYLGYLDINAPKYKILAKKLSDSEDSQIFELKEKGKRGTLFKSSSEIISSENIISKLSHKEAQVVGYAFAEESILKEKQSMKELLNS